MDFIERIFGVSPDHGDGSLERLYLVAILAVLAVITVALYRRLVRSRLRSGTNTRS
jgi:Tfp pilus assembly protein PilE